MPQAVATPNAQAAGFQGASVSLYRPSTAISQDAKLQASFDHFQSATSYNGDSCFGGPTWSHLAMQMSYYEPAIRDSVFVLGSLLNARSWEREDCFGGSGTYRTSSSHFMLSWERRTMLYWERCTKTFKQSGIGPQRCRSPQRTVLLLRLLLVWTELLQNKLDLALLHLQSGLETAASLEKGTVEPCLLNEFVRLYSQAKVHGSPTSTFDVPAFDMYCDNAGDVTREMRTANDARFCLDLICAESYSFLRRIKTLTGSSKPKDTAPSIERLVYKEAVENQETKLAQWYEASAIIREQVRSSPSGSARDKAATCLLELQYTRHLLVQRNLCDPSEMSYDAYTQDFLRLLDIAEEYLQLMQQVGHFPVTFDIELIPALFLVALKCRSRPIRNRAVSLLERCPYREGLYHRDSIIKIAEWKYAQEGQGFADGPIPPQARIHSEKFDTIIVDGRRALVGRFKRGGDAVETLVDVEGCEKIPNAVFAMADMI